MICYLCHTESEEIYYKICKCNSSTICKDCYSVSNEQEEINPRCPMCRRNLDLKYKVNILNFIKNFFVFNTYFIASITLKISLPLVIFFTTEDYPNYIYSNKIVFLVSTLIIVIFIGELNKDLFFYPGFELNNHLPEDEKLKFKIYLDLILVLVNIMGFILLSITNMKFRSFYYAILVIIPCNLVPFVALTGLMFCRKIIRDLEKLYKENSSKRLKILQVVYNNQSEV